MTDKIQRPPMKAAMAEVMGDRTMTVREVMEALRGRGWLPSANDPQQYIAYMISSSKDTFERVGRGVYRRRRADPPPAQEEEKKKASTLENVPLWLQSLVEFVESVDAPLVWRGYVDKGGPEGAVPCTAEELASSHPARNDWTWVIDASPVAGEASYEVGHLLTGFEEPPEVSGSVWTLEIRGKYRGISVVLMFWYEADEDVEAEGAGNPFVRD